MCIDECNTCREREREREREGNDRENTKYIHIDRVERDRQTDRQTEKEREY